MTQKLIYALIDPRDGDVRYVGKSCSGLARPKQHFSPKAWIKYSNSPIYCWLRKMSDVDLIGKVEIVVVQSGYVTKKQLAEAEVFFIKMFRERGCRLTNIAPGGEWGTPKGHGKGRKVSDETRKKISAANKGKKLSAETRQKLSEAKKGLYKGRKLSAETRQKMSDAAKGHVGWMKGRVPWNKGLKGWKLGAAE